MFLLRENINLHAHRKVKKFHFNFKFLVFKWVRRSSRIKDVLKPYITDHFECTIRTILAVHRIVEKKIKNEKSYLFNASMSC